MRKEKYYGARADRIIKGGLWAIAALVAVLAGVGIYGNVAWAHERHRHVSSIDLRDLEECETFWALELNLSNTTQPEKVQWGLRGDGKFRWRLVDRAAHSEVTSECWDFTVTGDDCEICTWPEGPPEGVDCSDCVEYVLPDEEPE